MKARTKAYLIFFLCFCLVMPTLVSCADSKGPTTNVDRPNNDYYDDSTRAKTKGNLPDDIDLDGETVYFFYFQPLELDVEGEDEGGFISANKLHAKDKMTVEVFGNEDRILLVARYDNLGKGASGAAVECLNIKLGCEKTKTLEI